MNLKYMKVSLFEIIYKKMFYFFTIFYFSEMHLHYFIIAFDLRVKSDLEIVYVTFDL